MVRTPPSSTRPDTLSPSTKLNLTRPLAVTSPKRSTALPDVPTLTEQGMTGADVTTWYGLLTTGGTPPAIVTRLNKELNATLQLPDVAARIKGLGGEIDLMTDQEFAAMNKSEYERYGKLLKASCIKADKQSRTSRAPPSP